MLRDARSLVSIAILSLVCGLSLFSGTARAQNTYADFPFNQGSLFYQYGGNPHKPRPRSSYAVPRTYARPATPWNGYARPWRGGGRYVTPTYAPPAYYYYPR